MPQMSPMLWSLLFIYFLFLFIIFNILNYFNFTPNLKINSDILEKSPSENKNNSLNWKW
nr:ATP synthase F0 subunit 8 [Polypedilum sp.]